MCGIFERLNASCSLPGARCSQVYPSDPRPARCASFACGCAPDASSRGRPLPNSCQTTSYTSLVDLGSGDFVIIYDRLANGWAGPPGIFGVADRIFAMPFTLNLKSDDTSMGLSAPHRAARGWRL